MKKKMYEYSYFRAAGSSIRAINTVEKAKKQIKEISEKLAQDYGAREFALFQSDEMTRPIFVYPNSKAVPEDFVTDSIQKDNDGIIEVAAFAHPKPGTPAEFNVSAQSGLIVSLRKRETLEDVLKCGDMPKKTFSVVGEYSNAFVRTQDFIAEDIRGACAAPRDRSDAGKVSDTTTRMYVLFNNPITDVIPLSFEKMEGNFYIRVPNDEKGKAVYTPPDSTPMDYNKMLELDGHEWNLRRGYKRPFAPGL